MNTEESNLPENAGDALETAQAKTSELTACCRDYVQRNPLLVLLILAAAVAAVVSILLASKEPARPEPIQKTRDWLEGWLEGARSTVSDKLHQARKAIPDFKRQNHRWCMRDFAKLFHLN